MVTDKLRKYVLPPTTSALLHNGSTLGISLRNMTDLLDKEENT